MGHFKVVGKVFLYKKQPDFCQEDNKNNNKLNLITRNVDYNKLCHSR